MADSKSTASDPFAAALRLLTRRDRSEAELRDKLKQFGFSAAAIESAIEKCRGYNYLDEQRYALERARAMLRSGRGVGRKVLIDLRRRGIQEAIASQALAEASREFEPTQLLRDQLERRFPDFDYRQADDKLKHRIINYFQRRGYHLEQIYSVLKDREIDL